MNPQTLVLSGLFDVRDRYLRALAGLDDALSAADAGTRTVLSAYRQRVKELLLDYHGTIAPLLEGVVAGWGDDPSGWDQNELGDLAGAAVHGFDLLALQHYDLGTHLPRASRIREDLQYLLMRAVDFSPIIRDHNRLISVHESQKLTWEASRFTQLEAAGPIAAAIAVPWLEIHTPLRWPVAVHELGHYFLPAGDPVRPRVLQIAADNDWRDGDLTSFREIVADAVAQRAFGDAYAFALAREGYLLSYETHIEGGVSVRKRLDLLGGPSDLLANLPRVWGLERRARPGHDPDSDETSPESCDAMRESAVNLVGLPPSNHPEAVWAARQLIRNREPPVAARNLGTDDAAHVQRLTALLLDDDESIQPNEIEPLTNLAVQRSLTDGEILQAAWLEECDLHGPTAVESLASVPSSDGVEEAARAVADRDTWLARALQSAAVHRWLLAGRDRVVPA